jgi:hypothetical protein
LVIPAGQAHVPLWHVCPPEQLAFVQQVPVMQAPLQLIVPAGQAHVPPWHVCPFAQSALVQHPLSGMQRPLHSFVPAAHAHAPDVQD